MHKPVIELQSVSEASRHPLLPLLRVQKDSLSALDHFARCEYAIAGDYLEWSLAQCRAALGADNPTDFLVQQA